MSTQIITRQTLAFRINGQSANNRIVVIPPHAVIGGLGDISFTRDYTDTDIAQYFYPPLPIDFGQFGVAWAVQAYNALAGKYNLATVSEANAQIVGVYYVADGNNTTYAKVNNAMLLVNISIVQGIQTNFDTNFDNLVSSITSFSTLFTTLFATQNTALSAITTALNNLQINIGDVDISGVDDIVTQLQNLYTINASQNANLSQLSQLANIVSAISNKDNQSSIVNTLLDCFSYRISSDNYRRNVFNGQRLDNGNILASNSVSLALMLTKIRNCFVNASYVETDPTNSQKFVQNIAQSLNQYTVGESSVNTLKLGSVTAKLDNINNQLQNIETKLENNLPFTTLNDITLNVDTVKKNCISELKDKDI